MDKESKKSKTMKSIKIAKFEFVKDESGSSDLRTEHARSLIAQMIEQAHQRGRPRKDELGDTNAA